MTTITPDPGNHGPVRPRFAASFRGGAGVPGTLTAVPHADQSQTPQKDVSVEYPGAPRPLQVRPIPLAELADQLGVDAPDASEGAAVTGITHDSRAVRPGDVYAALAGARLHGADFAAQAADLGAVAVLTDPAGAERAAATGLPVLAVDNPRGRMGALAATIYGEPGADLLQIGITGTSGKTTTAYLIEGGLKAAAKHDGGLTGLIGTVETRIGDERIKSERTTPEATDLQALFAVMRERDVHSVVMEVSSHALVLGRVDGCVFDVAVFNNLSPEHMEFHSGMEDYFQAKAQLFTKARSRAGVINYDDEYGRRLIEQSEVPVTTFSAEGHPDAHWRAADVEVGPLGSTFTAVGPNGESVRAAAPLPGPFNVANALAAVVALAVAGIDPQTAADGIAAVPGVPGRLERVDLGQPYLAVVDYAHKTDAVESVLRALRKVTDGKLHAVLGCGGDRDRLKRGPMGAAVARYSDTAVLTSDNPRSEDPLAILAAMLAGAAEVPAHERGDVLVEEDRANAIAAAVARAEPGDTVIVAGKGHELGQDIAGVIRAFDDRQVLREAIELSERAHRRDATRPEASPQHRDNHQDDQG
ncbi:UDP-N-acetylmuramoyl-L-alanyl-D-glutamate--2,6-diaminopimelate ligase [Streptomyces antimycoticus]|uniref:UDP-N-acetylmuramoyl-L-alanyl-D-glutamate--2,6-diaminopimelate ligase n=3 Tax=Streptomyces TaxID=1883 RepID=A0ABD5JFH2_9ACTN|nr:MULTISPECIES: UDP-N-acetylmuramoyl-L-alanyl-D-glutamate--2,6-diaminopimelate ligase [Streptomyces]MEE4587160.1 UDP-N-acetylmuramoyl-L-alanyl-D-glutamate--2,6-diaminopimelate ligase [Streptomyces sp. DSM 41602]KUL63681.1 UDP-N-acetylmuramoylalanyl-D-glutamate--2,6-diaminopimelate ligase [Streptomyces violaceusniger]QTI88450.1 UDP-N-acetylmuramoyl-L-alanyl-D-glutamate--2,6-diaminopimelate ligase [Streptomyces sp. AgN23]RSS33625.1 UDP-N-acetylmuramoyl-L-alanyl-D-glutamate--2,6-diaminopimelate l